MEAVPRKSISIDKVKEQGVKSDPLSGRITYHCTRYTGTWVALSKRFGKLPLSEVLKPAIEYASEGYPVSAEIGMFWNIQIS